jgi:cation diffusion facilitator CzcD-associated flavoprotein CzcO
MQPTRDPAFSAPAGAASSGHPASARPLGEPRIAIVGSGFAGIAMAIRLKEAGLTSFTVYEQAADIGGTWRDNTYPGAACDVPSHLYSFSFEPNPNWSRSFGQQQEILAYLNGCVDKYGIRPFMRFNAPVTQARFDEATQRWHVDIGSADGLAKTVEVDLLIAASGPLSRPAMPAIPGIDRFAGKLFHSARWDHDYALEGKRVAVIGSGASAIQFVPHIAPRVGTLHLFQRTAPWIIAKPDHPISARSQWLFKHLPITQRFARSAIYWQLEARALGFVVNPRLMKLPMQLARRHLRKHVTNPELRRKLTPDYVMGCKRVLLSNDYYPTLARSNVEVVTNDIREVTPEGIVTADGARYLADVIICGTGFQVNDVPAPFGMLGVNGADLNQQWQRDGPEAYLGTAIANFPNMFMIVGPNTGLGHNSMIYMIEAQVTYIAECIAALQGRGARTMTLKPDIQQRFNERLQHAMQRSVWTSGCHSWYLTKSGKNTALWPDFTFNFKKRTRNVRPDDYHFSS